ncbi:MAG TPA: glutamyl-tRNA reductase [Azospirillaceae bacterium]|nr:glutamyl-tRNA reductase [Azospirillaceae bacterium]
MSDIHLIGIDHRSAAAPLIDQAAAVEAELPELLGRLRCDGVGQGLLLSTCDRLCLLTAGDAGAGARALAGLVAERAEVPPLEVAPAIATLSGPGAARRLFAIAASLESRVPGEPHVLGQVKAAHRRAAEAGLVGPELEGLLQAAYQTAKRVRTETAISEGPATMAAVAVRVARDIHGDLKRCAGLLVGMGDMGVLLAEELAAAGLSRLSVTAPSAGRAEALARSLNAHHLPWADLESGVAGAEIIVTAMGAGRYILGPEAVAGALRKRRRKPVFLVDSGVPADVDPGVDRLEGAFLYGLDDLERLALEGRAGRDAAASAAWRLVDEGVAAWERGRRERTAVPLLTALRGSFEAERARLLAERPDLEAVEATRLLVNRLLHRPTEALRQLAGEPQAEELVRRMFGLDGNDG